MSITRRIDHLPLMAILSPVLSVLVILSGAVPPLFAERPNIVFILADDVGVEPLGCYGGESFETPRIDRLAVSGMRFEHCYSMPVCHPTRISFLTGRYPRSLKNPQWGAFPKYLEHRTVSALLQRSGYATAVAGKWQLTLLRQDPQQPHRMGFDEYCLFGWHEGARYHDPLIWKNGSRHPETEGRYGPDVYVDFLIDFMKRHRASPFFAFYSMALCHDVTDDLDEPVRYPPGFDRYLNYGEMVASMDQCVGRIVDAVSDLGLTENTLIIFAGDNGTARRSIVRAVKGDRKRAWNYQRDNVVCRFDGQDVAGGKGSLQDTGTHVPLLAVWEGKIAPGQTVQDLVDFSDFFPTLTELAQAPVATIHALDGLSFAARLTVGSPHVREWAYAESKSKFWVRTQRYKLTSTGQFFDLKHDPKEHEPLAPDQWSKEASTTHHRLQQAVVKLKSH